MNTNISLNKLWGIEFAYILVINIINAVAFGITIPVIPGYVVSLGASLSLAGVVTGTFAITALFVRPLAGIIGDKYNKKLLLVIWGRLFESFYRRQSPTPCPI